MWEHLQGVSELTGQFASKIGLSAAGQLVGLVHDIGKGTLEFTEYISSSSESPGGKKLDHSTAGAQVLYEAFLNSNGMPSIAADVLSVTVASHHGFMDILTPDGCDNLSLRLAKNEAETRKSQALSNLPPNLSQDLQNLLQANISEEIEHVLRKAIEENYTRSERYFVLGLLTRYLLSCLIDADRINAADFDSPTNLQTRQLSQYIPWQQLITQLEDYLSTLKPQHEIDFLRREISENCLRMAKLSPGIFRLSVPTGAGKTLASLRFALHHANEHGLERIIYVIPYTSIIDQNAQNIRKALAVDFWDSNIILEHHSNFMPERISDEDQYFEESEEYAAYKLLAENWDSPIVLTTMVQFLESLYGFSTNSCRRMHQLAKAVIIFDEIQTLPVNMVHLFNLAIKFLVNACGTSVMLCTATQPLLHNLQNRARSLPYDSEREITVKPEQKRKALERVEVVDLTRPKGWSNQEVAELAVSESNAQKSVLVITNTKRTAEEIYKHVRREYPGPVYHLSTKMCPAHRLDKLDQIVTFLKDGESIVLVSTQLIEAGVDVDFDVVIRFLAGIDSIAQAAGRCNRHGARQHKGRVLLVNSNEEHLDKLPDIAIAKQKAERVLEEFRRDANNYFQGHLLSDPVLERYFLYYFYERDCDMPYPVDQTSPVKRHDNLVELLSYNFQSEQSYLRKNNNRPPNRVLRQSFRSAAQSFEVIPDSGHGIIVPYKRGEELIAELARSSDTQKLRALLRKAQRFSINCFTHELRLLHAEHALREVQQGSGIFCLLPTHYHDELGWTSYPSS